MYFDKIISSNYTTYILRIHEYTEEEPYFLYFVITQDETDEKAGYSKYIPDGTVVFIDAEHYNGKIQLLDIDEVVKADTDFSNGQPMERSAVSVVVTEECENQIKIIPHNCGLEGNHAPGVACDDRVVRSYYEIVVTTFCHNNYSYVSVAVPESFMDISNHHGGGATPPACTPAAFEASLSARQLLWWNNPQNADTVTQIMNLLIAGNCSVENKTLAIEMVEASCISGFKLNIEKSVKSPINIDDSEIDTTTVEGKKFKCIYEKLTNSPQFKRLFLDVFGDNSKRNVKFKIEDLPGNNNGGVVGNTSIVGFNPNNNLIKIDSDMLFNGTNFQVAQIILHEIIHAFLNVKLADPQIGITIPTLNNTDFAGTVNAYYNGFLGDQDQHDFIYEYLLPSIKTVFSESNLATPQDIIVGNGLIITIPPNSDDPAVESWDWNLYFENISLNGLQNCNFFKTEIADGTTIVDPLKHYRFLEYNSFGRNWFSRICN